MRFLLDHDVAVEVGRMLRHRHHECWTAGAVGLAAASDDALTVWASGHGAVVVSTDREYGQRRTIEGYVTSAEQNGGGWVQLTFHHICNGCDAYSITAATMQSLLDWLNTQVTSGAVAVETTGQVIGGTYKTPFCC